MATAVLGDLVLGDAVLGDTEGDGPWAANGTLTVSGAASLTLAVMFAAAGTLALAGAGGLTTDIQMAANGQLVLTGAGDLRVARFVEHLSQCGHPLSTVCQDWLLEDQ